LLACESAEVTGRLHLTTIKEGELRAAGRVEAVDAIFRAYGQQLVVDPGVLVFGRSYRRPGFGRSLPGAAISRWKQACS